MRQGVVQTVVVPGHFEEVHAKAVSKLLTNQLRHHKSGTGVHDRIGGHLTKEIVSSQDCCEQKCAEVEPSHHQKGKIELYLCEAC